MDRTVCNHNKLIDSNCDQCNAEVVNPLECFVSVREIWQTTIGVVIGNSMASLAFGNTGLLAIGFGAIAVAGLLHCRAH